MSGVITSSSFAKLLWPGLNAIYGKEYNDYAVEWDKLFEKNTSDKAYEEDLGLVPLVLLSSSLKVRRFLMIRNVKVSRHVTTMLCMHLVLSSLVKFMKMICMVKLVLKRQRLLHVPSVKLRKL
jgi:hypothetical protein